MRETFKFKKVSAVVNNGISIESNFSNMGDFNEPGTNSVNGDFFPWNSKFSPSCKMANSRPIVLVALTGITGFAEGCDGLLETGAVKMSSNRTDQSFNSTMTKSVVIPFDSVVEEGLRKDEFSLVVPGVDLQSMLIKYLVGIVSSDLNGSINCLGGGKTVKGQRKSWKISWVVDE